MPSEQTPLLPFANVLRIAYIDNLRACLTILWIFHDASIAYGGRGDWPYWTRSSESMSSATLTTFNVINQAFVPCLFFLISGHCSAMALEIHTTRGFLRNKVYRLGLGCVLHYIFLQVIFGLWISGFYSAYVLPIKNTSFWAGLVGPSSYMALLFLFDVVYVGLRAAGVTPLLPKPRTRASYQAIATVCMALVVWSMFLTRNYRVHISLDICIPAYIVAYIAGVSFGTIKDFLPSRPLVWFTISYFVAVLSMLVARWQYGDRFMWTYAMTARFLYAVWSAFCMYYLGTSLISTFQALPAARKTWGTFSRYSYGAIFIHTAPVIFVQIAIHHWVTYGVLKAAIAGSVGTGVSWAMSWAMFRVGILKD